jgi:DNA-binding NarL/FixJ family response regulator
VIRVLLADDQALIRAGFRVLIDTAGDLQVVGEATDGQQAVDLARRERADVVLMDIRMPGVDGLEATRRISADEDLAGVKVIILTTFESDEYVYQALRAGASGFLVKDTEPADLIQAVRVVARGDALLSPSVTRRLITDIASRPERPPPSDRALASLTDRERQVMALVAEGLSNDEIAARLFLSPLTSKTHVSRIMTKLNARDRAQLVVLAYETGLVTPGGRDRHPRPRLASRRLPPKAAAVPGCAVKAARVPERRRCRAAAVVAAAVAGHVGFRRAASGPSGPPSPSPRSRARSRWIGRREPPEP